MSRAHTGRPHGLPEDRPERSGSICLILGPMFSGKSTELSRRVRRATIAGQNALLVLFSGDVRYSAEAVLVTHDGAVPPPPGAGDGRLRTVRACCLADVEVRDDEQIVGVDEGQFFPDLADVADGVWAGVRGLDVVVSALDGDFARRPFPGVAALLGRCEDLLKLRGVCMSCRRAESAFTCLVAPAAPPAPGAIMVGGRDLFRATCRRCYPGL